MEDFVVFEIVRERGGRAIGIAGEKDGRAGNARGLRAFHVFQEIFDGQQAGKQALAQSSPAGFPGGHDRESNRAHGQRQPAAMLDLRQVGAEENQFDGEEQRTYATGRQRGQFHKRRAAKNNSSVVMIMVSTTAMP